MKPLFLSFSEISVIIWLSLSAKLNLNIFATIPEVKCSGNLIIFEESL